MKKIVDLNDLSLAQIQDILDEAIAFKNGKVVDYHQKKVVANLFFEPSTRTHYSFDMAAGNLGCRTQNFEASNSSLKKGETLYDTCKLFESIGCDALVIRHPEEDYFKQLEKLKVPILNAGDGKGNQGAGIRGDQDRYFFQCISTLAAKADQKVSDTVPQCTIRTSSGGLYYDTGVGADWGGGFRICEPGRGQGNQDQTHKGG